MSISNRRIELSIDPEEEPYKDRIDSYKRKMRLTEVVQTCTSELSGIHVTIGIMNFQFMGCSRLFFSMIDK
ncbi:Acetyl-coenzyme A carboxylase carboxyl transferase subunit beta, chloroplastic, partial [Mucuna pruriens]